MIPYKSANLWRAKKGFSSMAHINQGACEYFANSFIHHFPAGEIVYTDNFAHWQHGKWPGGHCWIVSEGRHYDSQSLLGVNRWTDLPFYIPRLKKLKTVTWLSKDWMAIDDRPCVVISIGDPGEDMPPMSHHVKDVLRIECHDIPDNVAIEDLDRTFRQFDWHDARRILEFEHRYQDHDIIVHCHAGISRSCAVALYLADNCDRLLDVSRPCTGQVHKANNWVRRQMFLTHLDIHTTHQVNPKPPVRLK